MRSTESLIIFFKNSNNSSFGLLELYSLNHTQPQQISISIALNLRSFTFRKLHTCKEKKRKKEKKRIRVRSNRHSRFKWNQSPEMFWGDPFYAACTYHSRAKLM